MLRPKLASFLAILFLLLQADHACAQKTVEELEQTWLGYFHQARFTQRSGLWVDLHYRMTDEFVRHRTMSLGRIGYIYHFSDRLRAVAGHVYAVRYSATGGRGVSEHRPWQMIQWVEKKKRFDLTQALRVEQRFREQPAGQPDAGKYEFNWRLRYNISCNIPLAQTGGRRSWPYVLFANEVMINAGRSIVYNYFDQNRTVAGGGYQFARGLNAHVGYMFIFQQDPVPGRVIHNNVIRIFVYHNIDLRKGSP